MADHCKLSLFEGSYFLLGRRDGTHTKNFMRAFCNIATEGAGETGVFAPQGGFPAF